MRSAAKFQSGEVILWQEDKLGNSRFHTSLTLFNDGIEWVDVVGLDGEVFALDRAMHHNLVETRRRDWISTNGADAETNTGFLLFISG